MTARNPTLGPRSTGSRSWLHLADQLARLLAEAPPPAVSRRTLAAARALAAALADDLAREYDTQREAAAAWRVDVSTIRLRLRERE